ncbi:AAA family ATPase [Leptospira kanakyensis]|uniref:ATP-binding protein n=1 Tax=Leptospira kanakyensis TaxID=2484968 RepID=A0A6N4PYN6_9LEPT|nr:ATP-binding protein [Leptospira kanakyensis]MCW7480270.1 ATP-binding protein [Leptospira kanakyensis]TGK63935.1 ATP-binding protein [Leptospira kanakyensis]TGK69602.1 ATP-binding protein [Leptospira kanakyensis]
MKIRKIKFENNHILGSILFDFTDNQDKTVDTIIIAGENGVGKSYLLNSIFKFSSLQPEQITRNEKRNFEIELSDNEIDILKKNENYKHLFINSLKDNILSINIDYSITGNWNQISITGKTIDNSLIKPDSWLFNDRDIKKILKMIFSNAEINFSPKAIQTVTSKNIDSNDFNSEKSTLNLATDITQLLIDVQSLDALEFTEWARKNNGMPIDLGKIDIRIKRFTSAFEFMFPNKKFKGIKNENNYKKVIFEEAGKEMDIDNLSSGEKQIVFRGSFLLKDKKSSKGAIILIDEPELSLHPNWQLKILSFFKRLFTNDTGEQTSQLFIATHSPFIIHNSNRNADKVIILQKNNYSETIISPEPKFYSWSPEKIIQRAFNISPILNKDKTLIFVEGETDEKYFQKCIEIFNHQEKNIEFKWIGRINEKGNAENTGDSALNQARTFFLANMNLIPTKIILLYDSDTNKQEETFGNLSICKMVINSQNNHFKIGVENLLTLSTDFNYNLFYKQKTKKDNYGAESIFKELDKQKLCLSICEQTTVELQKIILTKVNSEIERLHSEMQNK